MTIERGRAIAVTSSFYQEIFQKKKTQGWFMTLNRSSLSRAFSQAILVNVLSPKSAMFFFAFLPQFVDAERGAAATQILLFGLIVVVL